MKITDNQLPDAADMKRTIDRLAGLYGHSGDSISDLLERAAARGSGEAKSLLAMLGAVAVAHR